MLTSHFTFIRDSNWSIQYFASISRELIARSTGRSKLWCGWWNFTGLIYSSRACKTQFIQLLYI